MVEERWRRLGIPGLEGYEVSDLGHVRGASVEVRVTSRGGGVRVSMVDVRTGEVVEASLGSLMIWAWTGLGGEGQVLKKLNGDPTDYRLENLGWRTRERKPPKPKKPQAVKPVKEPDPEAQAEAKAEAKARRTRWYNRSRWKAKAKRPRHRPRPGEPGYDPDWYNSR